jgi:hypothetical protein
VTDPIGTGFVQNDSLSLSLIQATSNQMYLKCFTGNFQYFSSNELRVGDRISFYSNTLTSLLKSPILSVLNSEKTTFISNLYNATFPVLQLLDYVKDLNGIYVPRDASSARTTPYVSSYNGFIIPNFTRVLSSGDTTPLYPGSMDPGTGNILEPTVLIGSNIPVLNASLQPVYTLELETVEPDTSKIGGKIVVPR